jgi:hypothetical protein
MALPDRDIYLRNHVMGVLAVYSERGLSFSNMGELADSIIEAVIEGDRKWQDEKCCEELLALGEDVPQ